MLPGRMTPRHPRTADPCLFRTRQERHQVLGVPPRAPTTTLLATRHRRDGSTDLGPAAV